jgi:hypothetical protein
MNPSCSSFRREWLFSDQTSGHADSCRSCQAWMVAARTRIDVLEGLAGVPAPAELDARVEEELSGKSMRRLVAVLTSLVRHPAPAALDVLARRRLEHRGDPVRGQERARAVAALDIHGAPEVLERLVGEELEHPGRTRVDRFVGTVTRLEAPPSLAEQLSKALWRRATLRTLVPPLATLAAAVLVVWLFARGGDPAAPSRRSYPFEVVRAADLENLDPLARQMGLLLGGVEGASTR